MAHSPLLRTTMRQRLDCRSVALVNYELALEDVSANLQQPPNIDNFDGTRWADLRKAHEDKKARQTQQRLNENKFIATVKRKQRCESRSQLRSTLLRTWEGIVPSKNASLRLTISKSGFTEWRPPLLSDSLLFEQSWPTSLPHGRVCVAENGVLDRRLLHHAISPKYVPKPHFKLERKRLEAKSAEFAAFVAEQTSSTSTNRILLPRPQDESSDEGLLSVNELEDPEYEITTTRGKRKRGAAHKPRKRTRKPARFVKLYDCKVHDQAQLKSQATNRFSLMQQRLPRVEFPPLERASRDRGELCVGLPSAMDIDEDPAVQELRIHGISLPVQFPRRDDDGEEEPEPPTVEEAVQYRAWRSESRPFFDDRDRYLQSRVYRERVYDRELLHAVQALTGFWAKVTA
ncbi:hypothetical protein GGR54DRAFT_284140 [Hypoxylon sp. NC1633]|nr:hypothetical protein GGR54DRAFT_284140 [Hypoxylon sp. NC1633]